MTYIYMIFYKAYMMMKGHSFFREGAEYCFTTCMGMTANIFVPFSGMGLKKGIHKKPSTGQPRFHAYI